MPVQIESSTRPSTAPSHSLDVCVGRYGIVSHLGQGSFGSSFQATDLVTNKFVVIKVLFPYLTSDESIRDRFVTKTRHLASISHSHLSTTLGAYLDGDNVVVVSDWFEGTNLAECVACDGPIPSELVHVIVHQVANGLSQLHDRENVHGCIKPSNILLTADGDVKILDLGLASLCDDFNHGKPPFYLNEPELNLVQVRHLASVVKALPNIDRLSAIDASLSTIAYTAPEGLRNPRMADRRCDIFSLGCIAYQLLTGQPLDGTASPCDVLNRRLTTDSWGFTDHDLITDDWKRIIKRMIAPKPEHRIASMPQLIQELDSMFDDRVPPRPPAFWKKLGYRCLKAFSHR